MNRACVLWFTGLSGSGKSTLASRLKKKLERGGKKVLIIDGDVLRNTAHKMLTFSPDDIKENNRRGIKVCEKERKNYDYIVVSLISPFQTIRREAKARLSPGFKEVYVKADIKTCIKRDVKGLYKKALRDEIENFIGLSPSAPYEAPEAPDIVVDTAREKVDFSVLKIMNAIFLDAGKHRKNARE